MIKQHYYLFICLHEYDSLIYNTAIHITYVNILLATTCIYNNYFLVIYVTDIIFTLYLYMYFGCTKERQIGRAHV